MHLSQPGPLGSQSGFERVSSNRLFVSVQHREVLTALSRIFAGPPCFSAVTGASGLGVTTLLNMAVADWPGPVRFVRGAAPTVLSDLAMLSNRPPGVEPGILIIDDAHDLHASTLELLGNLGDSLVLPHVVLAGRTELWVRLQAPTLNRLDQHILHRSVLFPMPYAEAKDYLRHLFRLAGGSIDLVLPEAAQHGVLLRGCGNMRRINKELVAALPISAGRIRSPTPQRRSRWPGLVRRLAAGALSAATLALAGLSVAVPEVFSDWPRAVPVRPAAVTDASLFKPDAPPARLALAAPAIPTVAAPRLADHDITLPQSTEGQTRKAPSLPPTEGASSAAVGSMLAAGPQAQAQPPPSVPVHQIVPTANAQEDVVAGLVLCGDSLLELHDISGARQCYERAAMSGSSTLQARAAAALASTFDPAQRKVLMRGDASTDAATALAWYRLAASLGDNAARASVKRLEGTLP